MQKQNKRGRFVSGARTKAMKLGLKRYKADVPCVSGHLGERLTSNGACLECERARRAVYYSSDAGKATMKRSRQKHHAQRLEDTREWRKRPGSLKWASNWKAEQRRTNVNFRIADCLRKSQRTKIINGTKKGSFVRDLGCSIDELRQHIEDQFTKDMTWENWGSVWQLDHIKPLIHFDLKKRSQFLQACHWSNLQPLLIAEHRIKSGKERRL